MKKYISMLTAAVILLCGCDQSEGGTFVTEEPRQPAVSTPAITENTQPPVTENPPVSSEPTVTGTIEEFPFDGIALPSDSPTYGNLPANVKEKGTNAFFCCDENGEIYYANLADNGFLYHLSSGKPEKLADQPASWITAVGNDIFFISPKGSLTSGTGETAPKGTVYRYSKTEELCEVYLNEDDVVCLHAAADGLYYGTRGKTVYENGSGTAEVSEYFKSFQSDTSEKQDVNYRLEAGGYSLKPDPERNVYCMTNGDTSVDIAAGDTMLFVNSCVYQNKIYAFFRYTFRILDLETGEMRVYKKADFDPLFGGNAPEISGYTVLGGCVYLCFESGIIVKIDENAELSFYLCGNRSGIMLLQLYTDGSNLYGCSSGGIYKIAISEEEAAKYAVFELGEETE